MGKIKTSLSYLLSYFFLGFCAFLMVHFLGIRFRIDPQLNLILFAINTISLVIILGVYSFTNYKEIGFVFLGLIIFKFFAIGYLAYAMKAIFQANIVGYFALYWVYLLAELLIVIRLVKKQD